MRTVTFPRDDDKGDVVINPESVSDVRTGSDGKVIVRLNNGAFYKLAVPTITDVVSALQATD